MSDFKFSCPQCGQHLSGDTSWSGRQIQCPGCQATITVPGASSAPPPLPPVIAQPAAIGATAPARRGGAPWLWIGLGLGALVLVAVLAVAAALILPALSKAKQRARMQQQQARVEQTTAAERPAEAQATTDPAAVKIAAGPVSGTLRGEPFRLDVAELNSVTLVLKQGTNFMADASLTFFLFLKPGERLDGRTITVAPEEHRGIRPHIHMARRESARGVPRTEIATTGYSLRLEFGERQDDKLPGRIYLETSDRFATKVSGSFEAVIKR